MPVIVPLTELAVLPVGVSMVMYWFTLVEIAVVESVPPPELAGVDIPTFQVAVKPPAPLLTIVAKNVPSKLEFPTPAIVTEP